MITTRHQGEVLGTVTLAMAELSFHTLRGERTLATGLLGLGVLHTLGADNQSTEQRDLLA